ncbi:4Fe-4S binding domain-containing protein [Marinospirillum celere]|uniref:4Fe-4S binding domain-containing protein n=1 Tax=Marinospirillum celere TaxID=1122252 RepID=A0A1I1K0R7_9GAMM|nr:4Fe-4S dicluster domain-containing protein [Marinospirillum celere]SFC51220.1 4Fe-4S binding domain-containing protein [Marinospirillum celere]
MNSSLTYAQALALTQPAAAALGWVNSRCLQAHPYRQACSLCLDACPAQALAFDETDSQADTFTTGDARSDAYQSLRLLASDACHGCGQCVAACPTEALLSSEHQQLTTQLQHLELEPEQSLALNCHRSEASAQSVQVHCLLSLAEDQLMAWQNLHPENPLELQLPKDCAQCPAQPSSRQPLSPPVWVAQHHTQARQNYQAAAAPRLSRRQLFTGASKASKPSYSIEDQRPAPRRLHRHYAARQRLTHLPDVQLPDLRLNTQACDAQGLCSRLCPSQALTTRDDGSLMFNRLQCLGCNQCVQACPEQALQLNSTASAAEPLVVELRASRKERCFDCGREFTLAPNNSSPVCPACRKDKALMQGGFASLFG